MITGFRLGPAGATGWSGVTPDLWCFGKVIGGGLPVGAFGGRRDLMAELAPGGPVYQAGTLSGNPLATAAGLAVLGEVTPADYEALAAAGRRVREGPRVGRGGGRPGRRGAGRGSAGRALRGARRGRPSHAPSDYEGARALAAATPTRGSSTPCSAVVSRWLPGAYEVMFPGLAHDEDVLARVVEAAGEAAAEVR